MKTLQKWLMTVVVWGCFLFLPSAAPAVTMQTAMPVATLEHTILHYDVGPVRVTSENVFTGSEAPSEPLAPSFGQVARLVAAKSLPNPHAGIRQASQYLQEMGVSRADRVRYLQSFEPENMVVRQAGQSEFGLRYFSDPSRAGGQYLFETFPASRASMAIKPEWSSMSGFRQFQIRPGATILEGRAAAQGPYLPGGQTQKFILDWRSDLIP